jgi:hypothetical protein
MKRSSVSLRESKQEGSKRPFVQLINEKKDILFGSFDDSKGITKASKAEAWKEINNNMSAVGINLIPPSKDWTYLRDTVWRNIKNGAKVKLDKSQKTGNGGDTCLTPFDIMVFDVEGMDSPSVIELNVSETWGNAGTNGDNVDELQLFEKTIKETPPSKQVR